VDSGGGSNGSSSSSNGANNETQWYFSQVKGTTEDEINEADVISTVEFNEDGELLATGDKGGRIVIFQREQATKAQIQQQQAYGHSGNLFRSEYNVYSTFQSHEAEFDYLKSLEIEEKINKIRWLRRKNVAHFLLSTNDKTVKLWKIRERNKRAFMPAAGGTDSATSIYSSSGSSSLSASGGLFNGGGDVCVVRDDSFIRSINIPVVKYMDRTEVEAVPKRVFANAHTYHINSISLNSDQETFMSADDLRINLWHIEITNQSFSK
jgi:serine/threonine-protein phosphatase 2A regulatory subunit B